MGKLEGKIAVITGGNRNIARDGEVARERRRLRLHNDHRDPELAVALQEMGRNVACVRGDVST